ncbi:MAG: hypothetical protein ACTSUE_23460 [Promethearchaeota archaeon]
MPVKKVGAFTLLFLSILIVFNILMLLSRTLPVPVYDILDFEFVWTRQQADLVLATWGQAVVDQETIVTYFDFGYLVGYGVMGFFLLILGAKIVLVHQNETFLKVAKAFIPFTLISAACDVVENINLLMLLDGFPAPSAGINAFSASLFATIKFVTLLSAVGFFGIELLYGLVKRVKKKD